LLDAIARDPELPSTARLLREIRESRTLLRVYPKSSILPVVRALKENRVVGIVADQHDFNGIVVDFLDHPARTPIGPAALALMTGAQLLPAFCFRREDNTFHIRISPPIPLEPTGDRDADIARKEQDVRDAAAQLEKARATLSVDERVTRERTLESRTREVQRLRQQFAEDLRTRQFEELDKLKERLDRVLTRYAKERNYDLILQDALFVGKAVDITDDIIKALAATP
jgi:hypothetical protein